MYSQKFLKSNSKKELIEIIGELDIMFGKLTLELLAEETVRKINEIALKSAESALKYKEDLINHKDREICHKERLLRAITNS